MFQGTSPFPSPSLSIEPGSSWMMLDDKGGESCHHRRVFPNIMVKIRENPMNKWMIWGEHHYFWKHLEGDAFNKKHFNTAMAFKTQLAGGFSPTHLKNMRKSNWIIFPNFRGESNWTTMWINSHLFISLYPIVWGKNDKKSLELPPSKVRNGHCTSKLG